MCLKDEVCDFYECCALTGKHDCSQCSELPCAKHFIFPDPNMSDEFKMFWLKLRISNLNKLRLSDAIVLESEFEQNVEKFMEDSLQVKDKNNQK